jgi:GT2 family glycosyltransferase
LKNNEAHSPDAGESAGYDGAPLASVVIVNWNASRELEQCLHSLYRNHPGLNLDVWVVDNASTDDSLAMLKANFPGVGLIINSRNLGFAAANNQAFLKIDPRSRFVLVLNPDVVFTEETLTILINFLETRQNAHVVTPRVLGPDGSLQSTCRRREPSPVSMLARLVGLSRLFPKSRKFSGYTCGDLEESATHRIDSASGSFLFLKREVLEEVGGFDERFFMYAEDLDWCSRARKKGFTVYYHPATAVTHFQGTSSGKRVLKSQWHLHYTALQYVKKHHRQDYPLIFRMILAVALASHFVCAAVIELMAAPFHRSAKVKVKE